MAERNEVPPQSQKPIDNSGFFSPIWHRFFLKLYKQANKTSAIETIISSAPASTGDEGGGSSSGSGNTELEAKLAFYESKPDLTSRVEELEVKIASLSAGKDLSSRLDDIEAIVLSAKNVISVPIKVDLWLNADGLKAPAANPATLVPHGVDSAWQFADAIEINQESITGTIKIPSSMSRAVAPEGFIGWSADGVSPGDCKWQVEYRWTAVGEDTTAVAQETLTGVSTASATSNGLVVAEIDGLDIPSLTDKCISFKVTRLSADAEDTIADTVELIGVCLSYISTDLGIVA